MYMYIPAGIIYDYVNVIYAYKPNVTQLCS